MNTADQMIAQLGLAAHPEGGFFREVYRSKSRVARAPNTDRAAYSLIYYLLKAGQFSAWHRVAADESWHFVAGDPLELLVADLAVGESSRVALGQFEVGERSFDSGQDKPPVPFHVVPAGCWQAARSLGAFSLVACGVAPGFEFEDFVILGASEVVGLELQALLPEARDFFSPLK